jgi:hypothetical protein
MRFYRADRRPRLIKTGLTEKEAQEHCSKESTHKKDKEGNTIWFDGYVRD